METIWDHNPTEEELIDIFGTLAAAPTKNASEDYQLASLAWLFQARGYEKKAWAYAYRISDFFYRWTTILSLQNLAGQSSRIKFL